MPAVLIVGPMLLSLVAWLLPVDSRGLTGFMERASVDWTAVVLLVPWIVVVVLVATFALTASFRKGPYAALERVETDEIHRVTLALGAIGTAWLYYTVTGGSLGRLVDLWLNREFYRFQSEVDYGVGLLTLRYAAVIAGGLSLARVVSGRRLRRLDVASLLLLTATVFAVSRLSGVMAFAAAVSVVVFAQQGQRIRTTRVVVLLIVVVGILVAASYSRNANFYERSGVSSPVQMAALDAQSYLATPMQVTWSVAGAVARGDAVPPSSIRGALGPVLPPYAAERIISRPLQEVGPVVDVEGRYQNAVDLTLSLTTNGVFTDSLMVYGWWALLSVPLMVGVAASVSGRFLRSGEIGAAVGGVGLYALAETWRVSLFNTGSLHFVLLIGVAAVAVGAWRLRVAGRGTNGGASTVARTGAGWTA